MTKKISNENNDAVMKLDDMAAVIHKINAMKEPFRTIGKRIHEIIVKTAPDFKPRVWYGMPGYAKSKNSAVLLFFRADDSYMTLGLTEKVKFTLDEGVSHQLMECAWFLKDLDSATEDKISEIVSKAIL